MERAQSATMSRRSSVAQPPSQTPFELDTASMTDYSGDSVMGNTGMFLLEDPGLQFYSPQVPTFRPLEWMMPDSAHQSDPSASPTPIIPSPTIPVSDITAAPFPVMSPPTIPVTNSPFAVGLQPRMPSSQRHVPYIRTGPAPNQMPQSQATFTPVDVTHSTQQVASQPFPQRGHRQSHATSSKGFNPTGARPRASHRLDRPPRSHQRQK